ncbi:hypothetical protein LG322_06110 [Microbacterium aerolatum]|uniref:hypothetical protein n=1 Tax=Microbacterium aerolatum TaxID=153731 RepID=UPI00384AF1E3
MIDNFLRRSQSIGEIATDTIRVIGVLSIVVAAIWFSPTDAGILAFALPGLLAPRFVGMRASFDIVYGVTLLIAAWSNVLGLYTAIAGWDLTMHVVATGVIAATMYLLLARWKVVSSPVDAGFRARTPMVIVPALGLAVSAVWEMVEWVGYSFISDEIFVAYDDTIGDMAVGGLGALIAGAVVARVPLERRQVAG